MHANRNKMNSESSDYSDDMRACIKEEVEDDNGMILVATKDVSQQGCRYGTSRLLGFYA